MCACIGHSPRTLSLLLRMHKAGRIIPSPAHAVSPTIDRRTPQHSHVSASTPRALEVGQYVHALFDVSGLDGASSCFAPRPCARYMQSSCASVPDHTSPARHPTRRMRRSPLTYCSSRDSRHHTSLQCEWRLRLRLNAQVYLEAGFLRLHRTSQMSPSRRVKDLAGHLRNSGLANRLYEHRYEPVGDMLGGG